MDMEFEIDLPPRLLISDRLHNRFVKEIMRELLMEHWQKRIPIHFTRPAHNRYGYAQRNLKYMKAKARRFHSTTDLVRSGKSKDYMTHYARIRVGGTAAAGDVTGTLELRFPFPGGTGRTRRGNVRTGVMPAQMVKEVAKVVADERAEISSALGKKYVDRVNNDTSPRQQIKI